MELNPDIQFIKNLKKKGGEDLKKCFQCATCSCVCNLSPKENAFPRKEMLWATWGLKDKLMNDADVWLCHYCNDCTLQCPRGAKPGNTMAAIRYSVIEDYAVPKFMGKVYASPKNLAWLLLIPFILFALFFYSNIHDDFSQLHNGRIVFARFFPHNILEIFWIGGNLFIFGLAAFSLIKFWNGIRMNNQSLPKASFISSLIETFKEILTHEKFSNCEATKIRKTGHMLVFFGFFGAMATAGLALIADVVFEMPAPINFFHPIKILGNLSGIALFAGCTIFVVERFKNKDGSWRSSYMDWSFLVFLYVVAITGLGTQFSRMSGIPELAYGVYIIHMTVIFFLLWFVMYSKFAHMFYRTIALTYAKQYGRIERNKLNIN